MVKKLPYLVLFLGLAACHKTEKKAPPEVLRPAVQEDGRVIVMPNDTMAADFRTIPASASSLVADLEAPAQVAATVIPSRENPSQNLVLFNDAELASHYTQLVQHKINIRTLEISLARAKDLATNGAGTGRDVLEAQTQLENEKISLIEHEAQLEMGGFPADLLLKAKAQTAWVVCEVPENQLTRVKKGQVCKLRFTAYPNEEFTGILQAVNEIADRQTRMIKLRILVQNGGGRLKAGMFATVRFGVAEGNFLSVPQTAIVTIQGQDYLFVRTKPRTFERRQVTTGQQTGQSIVIFSGIRSGDEVVTENAMQLKGISFGF
ncbi:efflux RND transporter periplasmic adaptor subunit [Siphonobacter aquaeclarae]|uniref:RND family efflux transporter, MFP subunit n=1 Tax=Siphonobacter aquaeclarae TaxID=563176 RepID=A0A1G9V115_9BACT|nr:efflux RND transporter periplasmic adaptor subunit [Siphonobacter aquaeclarae]SDM65818.1 RND family efflux transporter, MFP subunit [Siphonobacter aquaeclarae]